ncbi:MAG: hypothetical protein LAO19_00645 [Acidobacteriia bacterium]|nr:hypothetical protein [Terriglobia bacterium]
MKTLIRTCGFPDCKTEVPEGFGDGSLCLQHYVAEATLKLETAKNRFSSGLGVDGASMDWLLAQVDFIVETIGNEDLVLDDFQRSELLELLLGIANLNECIHHSDATVRKRL